MNKKLLLFRKKFKFTQQELAKYLNITRSAYTKKELCSRQITIAEVKSLALLYKISVDEFINV